MKCVYFMFLSPDVLAEIVRNSGAPKPIVQAETKLCATCKAEKPISEFYKPDRRGKIPSLCKKCIVRSTMRSYYKHHEKQLASAKAYRLRMKQEGKQPTKRQLQPQMFPLDAYQHDDILYREQQYDEQLRERVQALIVDNEFLRVLYEVGNIVEAQTICNLSDSEVEVILAEARKDV